MTSTGTSKSRDIKILNQLKQLRRINAMHPLAHNPAIMAGAVDLQPLRASIDPRAVAVAGRDGDGLPARVVGVAGVGGGCEGVVADAASGELALRR